MRRTGFLCLALWMFFAGCSSQPEPKAAPVVKAQPKAPASNNPVAKYLEITGIRTGEKGPGNLEVTFAVVNHSDADIGDLGLNVSLRSNATKPDDPPICTFAAKVPTLGPEELKQVTVRVPTKLRVYELPDWQFLKADFQVTSPQ